MKASSTIQQFAAAPAATIATAVQAERPRAGEPSVRLGSLLAERAREAESMYAFLYFTRGGSGTVYYAPPGAVVHADARLCRSSGAQAGVLALAKVCGGSGQEAVPGGGAEALFGAAAYGTAAAPQGGFDSEYVVRPLPTGGRTANDPKPPGLADRIELLACWIFYGRVPSGGEFLPDDYAECSVCMDKMFNGDLYVCDACQPLVHARQCELAGGAQPRANTPYVGREACDFLRRLGYRNAGGAE